MYLIIYWLAVKSFRWVKDLENQIAARSNNYVKQGIILFFGSASGVHKILIEKTNSGKIYNSVHFPRMDFSDLTVNRSFFVLGMFNLHF